MTKVADFYRFVEHKSDYRINLIDYLFHQLGQRRKTNPVNPFDTASFANRPHLAL
jgi:hypothetical protein